MTYRPGTHIIASLQSASEELLSRHAKIRVCIDGLIRQFELQKLGEVYYDFPTGGYTAVICLSESHISIHTWPEHSLVNIDIYLSNFQRNNDGTVENIYSVFIDFFDAIVNQKQTIIR
jgi:S-adenosylmethionine decarboxylase